MIKYNPLFDLLQKEMRLNKEYKVVRVVQTEFIGNLREIQS